MTLNTSRLAEAARPLHNRVRRSVAIALRERVAGQDNAAKAAVIWDKPGERWFTPADPIWQVHADASMFVAGIRALLLQSLHRCISVNSGEFPDSSPALRQDSPGVTCLRSPGLTFHWQG
jgi:hypothetical protein